MAKEKKSIFKQFADFINQGNVVDMAVGVIIGGAFGKIVTSLVNDIIMPLVGTVLNGVDFSTLHVVLAPAKEAVMNGETIVKKATDAVTLNYGMFIQQVIDFLIIAICVFLFVKMFSTLREKLKKQPEAAEAPAAPPAPSETDLLTEIRDLLKENETNK